MLNKMILKFYISYDANLKACTVVAYLRHRARYAYVYQWLMIIKSKVSKCNLNPLNEGTTLCSKMGLSRKQLTMPRTRNLQNQAVLATAMIMVGNRRYFYSPCDILGWLLKRWPLRNVVFFTKNWRRKNQPLFAKHYFIWNSNTFKTTPIFVE